MTDIPIERHTRPEPPSAIGKDKAAHTLTDSQTERDFLASFQPPPPVIDQFSPPHIPEPEGGPEEYTLPAKTVIYDEDGNEINRLTEPTLVRGSWSRDGGKANFT